MRSTFVKSYKIYMFILYVVADETISRSMQNNIGKYFLHISSFHLKEMNMLTVAIPLVGRITVVIVERVFQQNIFILFATLRFDLWRSNDAFLRLLLEHPKIIYQKSTAIIQNSCE